VGDDGYFDVSSDLAQSGTQFGCARLLAGAGACRHDKGVTNKWLLQNKGFPDTGSRVFPMATAMLRSYHLPST
jgi:hypothetical protein